MFGLGLWLVLLVPASAALAVEGAGQPEMDPQAVNAKVDEFNALLIEVMQTAHLADRVAALEPGVAEFFDIDTISRITLGRTWRQLDDAQKSEFRGLLKALIVATYADRFDSYDRQRFVRLDALATRKGWVVKTQLVRANSERVNLDYYFNADSVFNVVADGVSDLSLRRADYNSIIKREGYDALIRHIRENIAELSDNDKGETP